MSGPILVLGLGVTGRAVLDALSTRGVEAFGVDDRPGPEARTCAERLSVELVESPVPEDWWALLERAGEVVVSPGVPDGHPVFAAADAAGVQVLDESDLATRWDTRPRCAVTGTNGKTTVVTLVTDMLQRSGLLAVPAGNTDTPLVAAIDDVDADVFVVEASSFRLGHAAGFSASPAVWLNFAPDHLDVHADLAAYEEAKARIWEGVASPGDAVANLADAVVAARAPSGATGFGTPDAACHVRAGVLTLEGSPVVEVEEMGRSMPHDLENAQAACVVAVRAGANLEACAGSLRSFSGLEHRMSFVAEVDGVRYVDDSKATTPHATLTAMSALPGAVLIVGGRNKGLDLERLADGRPRAVVAIGEAAESMAAAFEGACPVVIASSMEEAVRSARDSAAGTGTVLLSPGCSSFDWYGSYAERGRDFQRIVRALAGGGGA